MLRSPRRRTDVEILTDATDTFVPMDDPPTSLPPGFGEVEGASGLVNPDLWLHVVENLDTGDELGRLVLCPDHEDSRGRFAALDQPQQAAYYLGLRPGEEHWLWMDDTGPFPAPGDHVSGTANVPFSIRAAEYLDALHTDRFPEPRHRFPIGYFAQGSVALPEGLPAWRIETGPPGTDAAGYLALDDNGAQLWWADRNLLIQGLLPPGPDGRWIFRPIETSQTPPGLPAMWSLRLEPRSP